MAVARYAHEHNTRPASAQSAASGSFIGWLLRRVFLLYVAYVTLMTCPSNPEHPVCRTGAKLSEVVTGPVHELFISTETGARINSAYNAHLVPLYAKHAVPLMDNTRVFVSETVVPALAKASKPACDALHRTVDPYAGKVYDAYSAHAKPTVDIVAGSVKQTTTQVVVPVLLTAKDVVVRVFGDYVVPLAKSSWNDYLVPLHVNHVQPLWVEKVRPAICTYSKAAAQSVRQNLLPGIVAGSARVYNASCAFGQTYIVPSAKRAAVHTYLFFTHHVAPPVRALYDQHMRQYVDRVVPWDQVELVCSKLAPIGSATIEIARSFVEEFYYMCYTIVTGEEHPTVIERHIKEQVPMADPSTVQAVFLTPAEQAQDIARKISGSARQWLQAARGWVAPANQQYVYDKATNLYHRVTKAVAERIPKQQQQPVASTTSVAIVEITMSASPVSTLEPIAPEPTAEEEEPVIVKTIAKGSVVETPVAKEIVAESTAVEETAVIDETTAAEETVAEEIAVDETEAAKDTVVIAGTDAEDIEVVDAAAEETLAAADSVVAEEPVVVEEPIASIATAPEQPPVVAEATVEKVTSEKATLAEVTSEQKPVVDTVVGVEEPAAVVETTAEAISSSDKPEIDANKAASAVYDAREAMAGIVVEEQQKKEFEDLLDAAKDKNAANLEEMPVVVNDVDPETSDDKAVHVATTVPAADTKDMHAATTLPVEEATPAVVAPTPAAEATPAPESVEEYSSPAKIAEIKRDVEEAEESASPSAPVVSPESTKTVTAQTTATHTVKKVVTVELSAQQPGEPAKTVQPVVTQYLTKTVRKQSTVTSQVTTTVMTTRQVTVNSESLELLTTDETQILATSAASGESPAPASSETLKSDTPKAAAVRQPDAVKATATPSAADVESPAVELPVADTPLVEEPVAADSLPAESMATIPEKEDEVMEETSILLSIVVPVDDEVRKAASNWVKDARKSISKEVAQERTRQSTSAAEEEQQQQQQQQVEQEFVVAETEPHTEPSLLSASTSELPNVEETTTAAVAAERAVAESAVEPKKEEDKPVVAPPSAAAKKEPVTAPVKPSKTASKAATDEAAGSLPHEYPVENVKPAAKSTLKTKATLKAKSTLKTKATLKAKTAPKTKPATSQRAKKTDEKRAQTTKGPRKIRVKKRVTKRDEL